MGGGAAGNTVKRCMTARCPRAQRKPPVRATCRRAVVQRLLRTTQRAVLPSCFAFVLSCAPPSHYETPSTLRGYEILVTRHDSLGRAIARGLKQRGFTVWSHVRGGSRPTAYLLTFTFRETDPAGAGAGGATRLHVRLADTRTGAIVAAVSVALDSGSVSAADRARAIVDSLAAAPALERGG